LLENAISTDFKQLKKAATTCNANALKSASQRLERDKADLQARLKELWLLDGNTEPGNCELQSPPWMAGYPARISQANPHPDWATGGQDLFLQWIKDPP
jgi:hypothetical protein